MEDNLLLFIIPVFILLICVEFVYGQAVGNNTYRLNDMLSNLGQGLISQAVAMCTPFIQTGIYALIYDRFGHQQALPIWSAWYGWLIAFLIYDFSDYWLHRLSHQCAFFWGAHVVHHQSQFFNLSTALRQESLYPILGCFVFFPMAMIGIPPKLFLLVGLFVLVYQFWIHTEHIGKLGWADKIFSTPSNHRVHHAINPDYIDKNFGAVLIIWDRLFGTFQAEQGKCLYGTVKPLDSWNPGWALVSVYADLSHRARLAQGFSNKCRVFYKNPGWVAPDSIAATITDNEPTQTIYNPASKRFGAPISIALFLLAAALLGYSLFFEDQFASAVKFLFLAMIFGCLYLVGFFLESNH